MVKDKIRKYREKLNLTKTEFAKQLNVSTSFLSAVENGKKQASMKLINKLTEITNYDYEFWTEQVVEITCSRCKRQIDKGVRLGNNNLKLNCECGREIELVLIVSTKIEAAYEVKDMSLGVDSIKFGLGESKRWQKEGCSQKK